MTPKVISEKCQIFLGRKYYRYEGRRYFQRGVKKPTTTTDSIHRAVWRHHNGPIPKGFHIHHIDGDASHNDINNLAISAAGDHIRSHWADKKWATNVLKKHRAWRSSKEGQSWRIIHYKKTWKKLKPVKIICDRCGKSASIKSLRSDNVRFCSNLCRCLASYERTKKRRALARLMRTGHIE